MCPQVHKNNMHLNICTFVLISTYMVKKSVRPTICLSVRPTVCLYVGLQTCAICCGSFVSMAGGTAKQNEMKRIESNRIATKQKEKLVGLHSSLIWTHYKFVTIWSHITKSEI